MQEFNAFAAMACGAYVVLVAKRRKLAYAWFLLFAFYTLIVRLSPEVTSDMTFYYRVSQVWPPPLYLQRLREPVFYYLYPAVVRLLGDRAAAFVLMDLIGGVIVFRAMKELDHGDGRMLALAPTVISSYVFLLGQQNVLRQHLSLIILLWSLAARTRRRREALLLFVLSALAHNVTLVFGGCWFDAGRRGRSRHGLLATAALVLLLTLGFSLGKSAGAFGADTRYLYVLVMTIIVVLLLFGGTGRIAGLPSTLLHFLVFLPAVRVLASAQFERVAMIFLVLVVVDLYRGQRAARLGSMLAAHVAYGLLVVPTLLFASSRSMLA